MKERINVLCATDEHYAAYCGVMLTSLLENNKNNFISIYIVGDSLSNEIIDRFKTLTESYNADIQIIPPPSSMFADCPIREGDYVSTATYYRIACGDILPDSVNRLIYLDCDILVNTDLNDLWNYDLGEAPCGAVIDSYHYDSQNRLKLNSTYFNAGVLLINVDYFRKNNVIQQCFNVLQENPDRIKMHDQDLLNIVIGDKVKLLPVRFNMLSAFLRTDHCGQPISEKMQDEIIAAVQRPQDLIIHFEYFPKPWQKGAMIQHPFAELWDSYRVKSLWKNSTKIYKAPLKIKARNCIMYILWFFKIKKKPKYYLI